MIYLITCLLCIVIAWILKKFRKDFLYFLSVIPLIIIGAIRYDVGIDYKTYSIMHIPFVLSGLDSKVEFLSKQIIYFGYYLSGHTNYMYIFSIFHIVFMVGMYFFIKKSSENFILSIYFLMFSTFYNFSLSGIRQSVASSIVLAFIFLLRNKNIKNICVYVLVVYAASLIHNSAMIYLIFILFLYVRVTKKIGIIYLLSSLFVFLFAKEVVPQLMEALNFYDEYIGSKFFTGEYTRIHQYFVIFVSLIINITYHFFIFTKSKFLNLQININYLLLFIAICMGLFPTPSRIMYLILPIYIVLIPNIYNNIKNKNIKIIFISSMITIFFILYIITIIYNNWYETLPYKTFLN